MLGLLMLKIWARTVRFWLSYDLFSIFLSQTLLVQLPNAGVLHGETYRAFQMISWWVQTITSFTEWSWFAPWRGESIWVLQGGASFGPLLLPDTWPAPQARDLTWKECKNELSNFGRAWGRCWIAGLKFVPQEVLSCISLIRISDEIFFSMFLHDVRALANTFRTV